MTDDIAALRTRLRSGTLPEALLRSGREVVLRCGDKNLTRDQLREDAERVAGGLHGLGITAEDRVAIYAANSLEWVIAYLGVQRVGACAVMMNPDYHSAEAEHIFHDSEPAAVVADRPRAAIAAKLGLRVISLEELPKGAVPDLSVDGTIESDPARALIVGDDIPIVAASLAVACERGFACY